MRIDYKILGKNISVEVKNGQAIIDTDVLENLINVSNTAYKIGYAKAKREEYESQRQKQIEGLKNGI